MRRMSLSETLDGYKTTNVEAANLGHTIRTAVTVEYSQLV